MSRPRSKTRKASLPTSNVSFSLASNWKMEGPFPTTTSRKSPPFILSSVSAVVCKFSSKPSLDSVRHGSQFLGPRLLCDPFTRLLFAEVVPIAKSSQLLVRIGQHHPSRREQTPPKTRKFDEKGDVQNHSAVAREHSQECPLGDGEHHRTMRGSVQDWKLCGVSKHDGRKLVPVNASVFVKDV